MSEDFRMCHCVGGGCDDEALTNSDFCDACQPDGGRCQHAPRNVESVKEEEQPTKPIPTFTEGYEDLVKPEVHEAEAILLKMIVLARQVKVTEMAESVAELLGETPLTFAQARETLYNAIIDLTLQLDDALVIEE